MPVSPGAAELSDRRTKHAKHYKNPDGTYAAALYTGPVHYQGTPGGPWLDKKQQFVAGAANEWVSNQSDVSMRTYQVGSGGNAKWWIEFKETLTGKGIAFQVQFQPTPVANTNELRFTDSQSRTWSYFHSPAGGKMLGPSIAVSEGAHTFTFPYQLIGGVDPLVLDASGAIKSGDVFYMPAPHLNGADQETYAAASWTLDTANQTLSFSYTDVGLPAAAYPYRVDPSTTFSIAAGANDGLTKKEDTVYPPAAATVTDMTSASAYAVRDVAGPTYRVWNALLLWDSSSLPDTAAVTGAAFMVTAFDRSQADGRATNGDWLAWSDPAAAYTESAPNTAFSSYAQGNSAAVQDLSIPLSNAAANVSTSGNTGLRLSIAQATADAAPTALDYFGFRTYENTSGSPAPRLVVDYTTTIGSVVAGMPGQHFSFQKASATAKAAGTWQGLWTAAGYPGAGAFPTGAGAGSIPTNATTGALPYVNPNYSLTLARLTAAGATQGTLILYDRLWHSGGYTGTLTSVSTVNSVALLRYTTGADVEVWIEYSGATGATASNLTVTYTNQANTASRTGTAAHANASVAGQMVPVPLAAGDTGVVSIQSIQNSSTTGAGTGAVVGLVLMRRIAELPLAWGATQTQAIKTYIPLGMPAVQAGAALAFVVQTTTTSTGLILGALDLAAV